MTDTTYQYNRRMVTPLAHVNIPVMRYRMESYLPALVRSLDEAKVPELDQMFQPWEIPLIISGEPFEYHTDHIKAVLAYLKENLALQQMKLPMLSPFDPPWFPVNKAMHMNKSSIEMLTHILYRDKVLRKEEAFYPIEGAAFIYGLEGESTLQIPLFAPPDLPPHACLLMLSDPHLNMEKELKDKSEEVLIENFIAKVVNTSGKIYFISN